jgi:hypothetical protein
LTHRFAIPLRDGFDYIVETRNWPEYWPDLVEVVDADRARWREPGDAMRLRMRLLGRTTELAMSLEQFEPPWSAAGSTAPCARPWTTSTADLGADHR